VFRIAKKRITRWPVQISAPSDDGKVHRHEALIDLEVLTQSEHDAIYAGGGTDFDLLNRVVLGWPEGQFQDENGNAMSFNSENVSRLLDIPYVRNAFVAAYLAAFNGREPARKN